LSSLIFAFTFVQQPAQYSAPLRQTLDSEYKVQTVQLIMQEQQ